MAAVKLRLGALWCGRQVLPAARPERPRDWLSASRLSPAQPPQIPADKHFQRLPVLTFCAVITAPSSQSERQPLHRTSVGWIYCIYFFFPPVGNQNPLQARRDQKSSLALSEEKKEEEVVPKKLQPWCSQASAKYSPHAESFGTFTERTKHMVVGKSWNQPWTWKQSPCPLWCHTLVSMEVLFSSNCQTSGATERLNFPLFFPWTGTHAQT